MRRARAAGFTLMELLIVVIIVGILASVALPQFAKMTKKSKATEGLGLVGAVLTAEWVYYQENSSFTGSLTDLLVDLPGDTNSNFDIGAPTVVVGPPATVTVVATGDDKAVGIAVTGTLSNDGTRNLSTTGI